MARPLYLDQPAMLEAEAIAGRIGRDLQVYIVGQPSKYSGSVLES